jgi:hypothetical protein
MQSFRRDEAHLRQHVSLGNYARVFVTAAVNRVSAEYL